MQKLDHIEEIVHSLSGEIGIVKEGVKRINGNISELKQKEKEQDQKLYKHEGFIQNNKAKLALVAAVVSAGISGLIGLALSLLG